MPRGSNERTVAQLWISSPSPLARAWTRVARGQNLHAGI